MRRSSREYSLSRAWIKAAAVGPLMRVTLIHNRTAGDKSHGEDELIRLLTQAGYDVDYQSSKGKWRESLDSSPDYVAVAGGDGTIGKVARTLAGTGVPIAILPLGTAK